MTPDPLAFRGVLAEMPQSGLRIPVLFVSAALNTGGAERQWSVLIPRLRDRGFDPSVLTLLDQGRFFEAVRGADIKADCVGLRSRSDVLGIARTLERGRGARLVVSQSLLGQAVAHAIARRWRIPHVTTEHQPPELPRRGHEKRLLKLLAPHVSAAVAVTAAQLPELVTRGYAQSDIRVIPNGISTLRPTRAGRDVRRALGLDEGVFVAVLAAALRPQKRPHVFVEAVERAHAVDRRIVGILIGDGPEFNHVSRLARGTNGTVRALGNRDDVIDLLAIADAVCLTSFAEAQPMVFLEAMALGKPMISTRVGGVSDLVRHEETGLLVSSDDAESFAHCLVRLARNRDLSAVLGANARDLQQRQFSAERMSDRYALLFESMVEAGGPTGARRSRR